MDAARKDIRKLKKQMIKLDKKRARAQAEHDLQQEQGVDKEHMHPFRKMVRDADAALQAVKDQLAILRATVDKLSKPAETSSVAMKVPALELSPKKNFVVDDDSGGNLIPAVRAASHLTVTAPVALTTVESIFAPEAAAEVDRSPALVSPIESPPATPPAVTGREVVLWSAAEPARRANVLRDIATAAVVGPIMLTAVATATPVAAYVVAQEVRRWAVRKLWSWSPIH